jgi:hypothetical protein
VFTSVFEYGTGSETLGSQDRIWKKLQVFVDPDPQHYNIMNFVSVLTYFLFLAKKMSGNNSGLAKKLAEMNSTVHTSLEKMVYQTAWSIADFSSVIESYGVAESLESKLLTIHLPSFTEETVSLTLTCTPNHNQQRYPRNSDDGVNMTASLKFANEKSSWRGTLLLGLLNKDGAEDCWETVKIKSSNKNTVSLFLEHGEVLKDASILLPDGELIIFVKATFVLLTSPVLTEKRPNNLDQKKLKQIE